MSGPIGATPAGLPGPGSSGARLGTAVVPLPPQPTCGYPGGGPGTRPPCGLAGSNITRSGCRGRGGDPGVTVVPVCQDRGRTRAESSSKEMMSNPVAGGGAVGQAEPDTSSVLCRWGGHSGVVVRRVGDRAGDPPAHPFAAQLHDGVGDRHPKAAQPRSQTARWPSPAPWQPPLERCRPSTRSPNALSCCRQPRQARHDGQDRPARV